MEISKAIRKRILDNKGKFFANDNISKYIKPNELIELQNEVQEKVQSLLESLVIDTENDHNTKETARRVAKMFIQETFSGRYVEIPKITNFPNIMNYDNLYTVGPIDIKSTCAHHFASIVGKCWIGVFPGTEVIGLSKFNRIVDWISSRPQIQEEMTEQIANEIQTLTNAKGVGVILKAEHMCLTHRGVKAHDSDMSTSVMRGVFLNDVNIKKEFLTLINMRRD